MERPAHSPAERTASLHTHLSPSGTPEAAWRHEHAGRPSALLPGGCTSTPLRCAIALHAGKEEPVFCGTPGHGELAGLLCSSVKNSGHMPRKGDELVGSCGHHTSSPESSLLEQALGSASALEQVQALVVAEVFSDIAAACKLLSIPADPLRWSGVEASRWLAWAERHYSLPPRLGAAAAFSGLRGAQLCLLGEGDFRARAPAGGELLHAHLDIWKTGTRDTRRLGSTSRVEGKQPQLGPPVPPQPIHLWQFLWELLLNPCDGSRLIRWLNRDKGIFKIEDSVEVARLWGIRKNRPAMNYDKLSRSIRQYYKKGIIRKTEISQRLVYQFVKPL
ncbi:unnamed protein product [Lampetra planeri]